MRRAAVVVALLLPVLTAPALAADKPGRYTMMPADKGFIRLDTETGAMALCTRKGDKAEDWACEEMPESQQATRKEIERLQAENKTLKDDIRRMEETFGLGDPGKGTPGDKKAEGPPGGPRPGGRLELPSEQDVDKALDYLGRMLRKFRDKLKELEPEKGGTPL